MRNTFWYWYSLRIRKGLNTILQPGQNCMGQSMMCSSYFDDFNDYDDYDDCDDYDYDYNDVFLQFCSLDKTTWDRV